MLALVGGGQWRPGSEEFDAELLEAGGGEILIVPTGAAYEHPARLVGQAEAWFASLGGHATAAMVLGHRDAEDAIFADLVAAARCVYLCGSSPLHMRAALKGSRVWEALVTAWRGGAAVAGSDAGAMVLGDPMVDPRGGALTVGLGIVEQMAVLPHFGMESADKVHRSLVLAGRGIPVVGIPESTALIRDPAGSWRSAGVGELAVYVDGTLAADGLKALPV
ncbi:MAG: Type 1 glutamine amidotransferase-like domain-containing protein [Actinomycetota bacterium]|nr:Type 1 glutamine amidotransferase-like domain-containing protein [Actinomycetota bacterium]